MREPTLDQMIAVMVAAKEGKAIEWISRDNPSDTWSKVRQPQYYFSWRWQDFDYRIAPEPQVKPKPREYLVLVDEENNLAQNIRGNARWVKFREVVGE